MAQVATNTCFSEFLQLKFIFILFHFFHHKALVAWFITNYTMLFIIDCNVII